MSAGCQKSSLLFPKEQKQHRSLLLFVLLLLLLSLLHQLGLGSIVRNEAVDGEDRRSSLQCAPEQGIFRAGPRRAAVQSSDSQLTGHAPSH